MYVEFWATILIISMVACSIFAIKYYETNNELSIRWFFGYLFSLLFMGVIFHQEADQVFSSFIPKGLTYINAEIFTKLTALSVAGSLLIVAPMIIATIFNSMKKSGKIMISDSK